MGRSKDDLGMLLTLRRRIVAVDARREVMGWSREIARQSEKTM
jgi:hypothetical protein